MKITTLTKNNIFALAVSAVAVVVFGLVPTMTQGYAVTLLTDIMRYGILTVAWVIFSGPTGYMSLATAAFYGVGFYIAAVVNDPLPFAVTIILAGAAAFVVALLVGALTLRLRGVYFCIFTFALTLLVSNVVLEVERIVTGTRGRFVATETANAAYYAMFIVAVLTILLAAAIRRSRYGLALQSVGEHEEAAAHSGINVVRTKVLVFAASAITMGMAGAIIATRRTYIDPGIAFNLNTSFLPVLMALFGGMGSLVGPVIGAAVFTLIGDELLTSFPDLYMLLFGVVLIMAMLIMPNGIVGLAQQSWLISKGERPFTRDFFVGCAFIPAIGWLTLVLMLGGRIWSKIRGHRAPAIAAEKPFTPRNSLVYLLLPSLLGLLALAWFLGWQGRLKWRGGRRAPA
jgi:branched-chain amino acid transport system permease protein